MIANGHIAVGSNWPETVEIFKYFGYLLTTKILITRKWNEKSEQEIHVTSIIHTFKYHVS